jgi:endogenous inhibitor of DNA gyrase (YacG/DUF329 family)
MKAVNCPTCKKHVEPEEKAFPFCSERCRLLDLGNWLGGNYRIGGEDAPGGGADDGGDDDQKH